MFELISIEGCACVCMCACIQTASRFPWRTAGVYHCGQSSGVKGLLAWPGRMLNPVLSPTPVSPLVNVTLAPQQYSVYLLFTVCSGSHGSPCPDFQQTLCRSPGVA